MLLLLLLHFTHHQGRWIVSSNAEWLMRSMIQRPWGLFIAPLKLRGKEVAGLLEERQSSSTSNDVTGREVSWTTWKLSVVSLPISPADACLLNAAFFFVNNYIRDIFVIRATHLCESYHTFLNSATLICVDGTLNPYEYLFFCAVRTESLAREKLCQRGGGAETQPRGRAHFHHSKWPFFLITRNHWICFFLNVETWISVASHHFISVSAHLGFSQRWGGTLRSHFQNLWVNDHVGLGVTAQSPGVGFFGLAPQVGAAVHAGDVQDSDALQRQTSEIQWSAATLEGEEVTMAPRSFKRRSSLFAQRHFKPAFLNCWLVTPKWVAELFWIGQD